ncbi:hypothetical protein ONZ45_g16597 [Pleurotus djamor]|nr:hypothetical protein ONZ45_g16597 [Pleurotus djamor]
MPPRRNSGLAATRASARLARADPVASDNAMPSIPGGLGESPAASDVFLSDAGSVSGDEPVAPVESTPRPSRVRSGDEVPGDSPCVLLHKPEGDVPSKDDGSVHSTPSGENAILPQADKVPRRLSLPQVDEVPRRISSPQADEVPRRMFLAQADEVPQPIVARTKGASGSVPQERDVDLTTGQLQTISRASQSLSPGERATVDVRTHANRWLLRTPSNGDVYTFDRRTLTAILDVAQWLHTGDLRPEQLEGEARCVYNMVAQTVLAETRIRGKLPYYNKHGVFNNVKWVLRRHLLGLAPPSYQRKRNLRLQNARSLVTGGRGHAFGRHRDWENNSAIPPAKSVSITTTPATRIKNAVAPSSKESWNGVGVGAEAIKDLEGMEDTLEHWGMEDFDLGYTAEEDDDFVEVLSSSVAAGKKASA